MEKFHPTYYGCNYLSILGLKITNVSKRGHWKIKQRNNVQWYGQLNHSHPPWSGKINNLQNEKTYQHRMHIKWDILYMLFAPSTPFFWCLSTHWILVMNICISVNNGSLPIQRQAFIPTLTYRQLDPYEQLHLTKSKDTNIFLGLLCAWLSIQHVSNFYNTCFFTLSASQ